MPKIYRFNSSGFTLVELLVVVGIIILLTTVGLTVYKQAEVQSRDSQRQASLKQVQAALEQFHNDFGYYPNILNFDAGGQIAGSLMNPVTLAVSNNVYLNILPRDPKFTGVGSYSDYKYISRPNNSQLGDVGSDCDNNTTKCSDYCLIAKFETTPPPSDPTCLTSANPGYNYSVRKGRN